MLRPIIGKRPKNKDFNYEYRFHKPKMRTVSENGGRPPIEFRRISRRGTAGSVFMYALILAMILWIIT